MQAFGFHNRINTGFVSVKYSAFFLVLGQEGVLHIFSGVSVLEGGRRGKREGVGKQNNYQRIKLLRNKQTNKQLKHFFVL